MKPYTNTDRWRHIKHFVDTHPYSEDNLDYLKNWLEHFTPPNQSGTIEQDIDTPMIEPLHSLGNRYTNVSDIPDGGNFSDRQRCNHCGEILYCPCQGAQT